MSAMLRYRAARCLVHMGLWMMPDSRYKRELLALLWQLYDKVMIEAALKDGG